MPVGLTKLRCMMTEAHWYEQYTPSHYMTMMWLGFRIANHELNAVTIPLSRRIILTYLLTSTVANNK